MQTILTLLTFKNLLLCAQMFFAIVWGLTGGTKPVRAEFRKIPVTSVESCALQLAGAADIPHTCLRYRDANAKLPIWETALGFEFGRLTYAQWQQLMATYTTWHNRRNLADYDRDRNYTLMDFMPPTLQAWNRHRFYEQDLTPFLGLSHPPTSQTPTAKLVANCWGTLYEILRLAQQNNPPPPTLFMAHSHPMLRVLRQRSMKIQPILQPGDIVLISHRHGNRTYLDHVVLAVDQQLFFEKAGSGDHVPYRLIDQQTLEQIWNPDIYTFEYRRPYAQQLWSPPQQVFGSQSQPWRATQAVTNTPQKPRQHTTYVMAQLPPFLQIHGRFHLPPQVYDPQVFVVGH